MATIKVHRTFEVGERPDEFIADRVALAFREADEARSKWLDEVVRKQFKREKMWTQEMADKQKATREANRRKRERRSGGG